MGKKIEHAEIGRLRKELILDTNQALGLNIKFKVANEDAKKILNEAKVTIEKQKTKEEIARTSSGE